MGKKYAKEQQRESCHVTSAARVAVILHISWTCSQHEKRLTDTTWIWTGWIFRKKHCASKKGHTAQSEPLFGAGLSTGFRYCNSPVPFFYYFKPRKEKDLVIAVSIYYLVWFDRISLLMDFLQNVKLCLFSSFHIPTQENRSSKIQSFNMHRTVFVSYRTQQTSKQSCLAQQRTKKSSQQHEICKPQLQPKSFTCRSSQPPVLCLPNMS